MKKFFTVLALVAAVSVSASAQGVLGSILGGGGNGSSAASTIGNIVSGLAGTVYSAPVSLNGTYKYNGIAVSVSSSEGNMLTNLAGTAVTSGIEAKADDLLSKVGIKPGVLSFTFNASDNTFVLNVGAIPVSGTYKVGDGEKTVTLTFGKKFQYLSMTGTLESTINGARMLFTVDKATALIKKIVAVLGQSSSQVGTLAKLADGYDNYRIGFKLSK